MFKLKSFFQRKKVSTNAIFVPFETALSPKEDLFIVGDIHGRFDLLQEILTKQPLGSRLVLVGDLIDRGSDSAPVLRKIKDLVSNGNAICIMGNHEKMLLDFIADPLGKGARWLHYGGLQTLDDFGIVDITQDTSDMDLLEKCLEFQTALSDDMLEWIQQLPLHWCSGNIHVVHAAADPIIPMDEQPERVLLWGTTKFLKTVRKDEQWVVHGHTIVKHPQMQSGRISIDTGAYETGSLSAAYITQNNLKFIST